LVKRHFAAVEAVHAQGPLIGDESAFEDRQEPKRENERKGGPDHRMQPDRRIGPEFLGEKHQGSNNMTDNDDRHIRWRIVGALMEEFLAATGADIIDLEIGAEHRSGAAAGGATAAQALTNGLPCIAGGGVAILLVQCFDSRSVLRRDSKITGSTYNRNSQCARHCPLTDRRRTVQSCRRPGHRRVAVFSSSRFAVGVGEVDDAGTHSPVNTGIDTVSFVRVTLSA